MSFQQNLQYLMNINGLSNYQLAKELECHQTSVANWLDGAKPQKKMLKAIADRFGLTIEELTSEEKLTLNQKEKEPDLTDEDRRDIAKMLDGMVSQLGNHNVALMFDGEPVDEETKELLKISLENQFRLAKKLMQQRKGED